MGGRTLRSYRSLGSDFTPGSINISPLRGWQHSLQSGHQLLKAFEVMGMSRPDRLFGLSFEENNLALLTRCTETQF